MTESQLLLNICNYIDDFIKDEFIKQGHELTGAWQDSIFHQEVSDGQVEGGAIGYGLIVNEGIAPERIPYGGEGIGGGKVESKYILGLARFWKLRKPELNDKQALRLAFATANVQKEEGMSTFASEQFSATGERQHFLEEIERFFEDYGDNAIFEGLDVILEGESGEKKVMYL